MNPAKPYVLSIAGFDPSGGAGILSDIKTIEANGGYGFGAISAVTCQNDLSFEKLSWFPVTEIIDQVAVLQKRFEIGFIKIGLIENIEVLDRLVNYLKEKSPGAMIIWDPVLKASAGFVFHQSFEKDMLDRVLKNITCITPNNPEACQLFGEAALSERLLAESARCAVYVKGGHAATTDVTDVLFAKQQSFIFTNARIKYGEKHGSGCVLSSALITQLALGKDLPAAAAEANRYTRRFLGSNHSLLGYHSYTAAYETD